MRLAGACSAFEERATSDCRVAAWRVKSRSHVTLELEPTAPWSPDFYRALPGKRIPFFGEWRELGHMDGNSDMGGKSKREAQRCGPRTNQGPSGSPY
jgi:hypothetical protein